jgi:hypothetical protein
MKPLQGKIRLNNGKQLLFFRYYYLQTQIGIQKPRALITSYKVWQKRFIDSMVGSQNDTRLPFIYKALTKEALKVPKLVLQNEDDQASTTQILASTLNAI